VHFIFPLFPNFTPNTLKCIVAKQRLSLNSSKSGSHIPEYVSVVPPMITCLWVLTAVDKYKKNLYLLPLSENWQYTFLHSIPIYHRLFSALANTASNVRAAPMTNPSKRNAAVSVTPRACNSRSYRRREDESLSIFHA